MKKLFPRILHINNNDYYVTPTAYNMPGIAYNTETADDLCLEELTVYHVDRTTESCIYQVEKSERRKMKELNIRLHNYLIVMPTSS